MRKTVRRTRRRRTSKIYLKGKGIIAKGNK